MAIIIPDDDPIPTRNSIYTVPGATLTRIADAIRSKTGGHAGIPVANMASEIRAIPTGGGGSGEPSVVFIDYDGTVVEEWTADQLASKTVLPNNPSHDRLVAQGWNWTLADIRSYITDYPEAVATVGQMYDTVSGLTEFDITVTKATGLTVVCNMVGNKNWGDGTSDNATSHTYADYGDYTITCDGTSIPSGGSSHSGIFGSGAANDCWCTSARIARRVTSMGSYAFSGCISMVSVSIPAKMQTIPERAFYNCFSLKAAVIPSRTTRLNQQIFYYCSSLNKVSLPASISNIGSSVFYKSALKNIFIPPNVVIMGSGIARECGRLDKILFPAGVTIDLGSAFYNCHFIEHVDIPSGVTSITTSAFYGCNSIKHIDIPSGVTSIGATAFYSCYNVVEYDFSLLQAVPSLINVDAFNGINMLCKILVPAALYDEWIAATNWVTYANYIYPV